ncbi:tRNA (N6-threonylcarbamoyladenosine(37)-N6)-methyltransferase TrmO [Alteromonas sp. 345S023]|uniref:tRNA (N6-threonylcarbamoyladenosine(37)-N6)-methyltransferase TrmO n=1 Tax=Alteromonas profundi TaxID=2696062 RepID=A0A7X5LNT2_9ALTE|nr:tRNA (N6-threonylcarbamoyladenosine(37)-N6)-methyltransferase TrmO [Alteromonas profundi]NDV92783.1 tRNA (N6-threonylcarbamoyladenosine(37)-N6)-methyltransferase TrmO [Alteromonas profundi]
MTDQSVTVAPIGHITSPFKQKFAIPRQPNLANASGQVVLSADFTDMSVFKGLEGFSHVWLLFLFHENAQRGWKPTVKAPRLGGNATMGVFASRSTHRPNGIGMSVVENKGVSETVEGIVLNVNGVDLLDGTPIIDIKPYLPYADCISTATDNLANYAPIPAREVKISEHVKAQLHQASLRHQDLPELIVSVLRQDARPAYKHKLNDDPKTYWVTLYNYDIGFCVSDATVIVTEMKVL